MRQLCSLLLINHLCISFPLPKQYVLAPPDFEVPDREVQRFVLPVFDHNLTERTEEIEVNREGYVYGPALLGNTSFFPTGVLGDAMVDEHKRLWFKDVQYVTDHVNNQEIPRALNTLMRAGGLKNLFSYKILYEDQWEATIPDGASPGTLTNWTQDVFFSMERLSINPYVVRRLHPGEDTLPFPVDDEAVQKLASGYSSDTFVENLEALHQSGRLFFADHSIQARYPANPGRWSAACSGYFFIHQESRDFLPLAIKTNVGSDLIYTPLDCENDWLFAKMAFNTNDLFHGQIYHLSATHDVAEPVHQAALRTLSNRHPVRGYLDRLMYQAYAVRPIGDEFLFNDGGFFDSSFAPTNFGGRSLSSDLYPAWAGRFQAAQFHNDLTARGLINCSYGPELRHMPFHRVVAPMVDAIHEFARAYVDSYYPSDALLVQDKELQNWVQEAVTEAQVLEFPFDAISIPQAAGAVATLPQHSITTRSTLTSILAHMAFLSGVGHHALNAATPGESSGLLPLHPSSFNQPLPTAKGTISSLMPYLHNATEAVKQASLLVRFNRPLLEQQEGSLVHMWSGAEFLARAHPRVREAAVAFRTEMERISDQIRGLGFDERGFARGLGLPFLWRSLDPRKIPYYLSV